MKELTFEIMQAALKALNEELALINCPSQLIIGGGGGMVLAHQFPLATADIDGVPLGIEIDALGDLVKKVALKLNLPGDWLNPYFSRFVSVLPKDYQTRLITVLSESHLIVRALGAEDLLLMKCFAHRRKDIPHARALVRAKANTDKVFDRIDELRVLGFSKCQEAFDFLEEVMTLEGLL